MATKGLSHTVSEINDNFSRNLQSFSTPCIFRPPPAEGFLLEFGNGATALGSKNENDGATVPEKEVWRYL